MATSIQSWPLVLLDLEDKHGKLEDFLNLNILRRFTNKQQCLQHHAAVSGRPRLLHFFIPNSEHVMIGAGVVPMNTIYYLYCATEAIMIQMAQQYNMPMMVKIFMIEDLLMNLNCAAFNFFFEQGMRQRHEPDERDSAFQTTADLANQLADDLRDHMEFHLGVEAADNR